MEYPDNVFRLQVKVPRLYIVAQNRINIKITRESLSLRIHG